MGYIWFIERILYSWAYWYLSEVLEVPRRVARWEGLTHTDPGGVVCTIQWWNTDTISHSFGKSPNNTQVHPQQHKWSVSQMNLDMYQIKHIHVGMTLKLTEQNKSHRNGSLNASFGESTQEAILGKRVSTLDKGRISKILFSEERSLGLLFELFSNKFPNHHVTMYFARDKGFVVFCHKIWWLFCANVSHDVFANDFNCPLSQLYPVQSLTFHQMIDQRNRVVRYPIQAAAAKNHHELQARKAQQNEPVEVF